MKQLHILWQRLMGAPSRRAGFTMIELLVVIVVLGILAASFASSATSARENARITKATAESRELGNSIRLFCMANLDVAMNETDPLGALGLGTGVREANASLTNMLTRPSSANGNTVYFNVSQSSLINNRICDPWGEPYRILVREVESDANEKSDDYIIIAPVATRHRALEPLN